MTDHERRRAATVGRQTEYTFYPTVRRGHRPTSTFGGATGVADAGSLGVELTVRGSGEDGDRTETARVSLRMYGPGDVVGLDRRQVVRVEPSENSDGFPPNQFPHVEFDRPDLPWLFSPQRADDAGRNRPWLSLVCVERDRDAVSIDPPGRGPLPVLSTPVAELPDPAESWAWAHAQVTGTHDPDEEFTRTSSRTVSRLVCPRNLDASTAYVACVVPTFEAGRRAGLGASAGADDTTEDGDRLSLAWASGDGVVRLPVYYSWEFRTGLEGDFESLVGELEPVDFGPDVGYRTVDVGDPGPDVLAIPGDEEATVELGGALKSADAVGAAYDDEYREELRTLLNTPERIDEAAGSPIVGPPKYGQWHAGVRTIEPPPEGDDDDSGAYPTWFHTLNTDPRYRIAAALGAETVRQRQEELMASAWAQAGDLDELNDRLRGMQLARTGLAHDHDELGEARAGKLLQFTAPVQDRLPVSTTELPAERVLAGPTTGSETFRASRQRTPLPDGATSPAFRRLTRANGPLARRAAATFDADGVVEALATNRGPSVTLDGLDRRVRTNGAPLDDASAAETATEQAETVAESLVETVEEAAEVAETDVGDEVRFLPDRARVSAVDPTPAWLTDDSGAAMTVEEAEAFHAERDDDGRDDLLVARTVGRVRRATKQSLVARARVLALRLAIRGETPTEPSSDPKTRVVQDSQALVDECERIRGDALADLEAALPDLAASPRPEAVSVELTQERVAELLDELRETHEELESAVTTVRSALQSGEYDPEDVLASLDAADEHLSRLVDTLETIDGYVETGRDGPVSTVAATAEAAAADVAREADSPEETVGREAPGDGELTLDLQTVQAGLASHLDPAAELGQLVTDLSGLSALGDRDDPTAEVLASPTFAAPMFRSLADLASEYLLPGVGSVPTNAMGALVTNPRFVEAYMAGLNHEMARELAWRRFPTDRRGSYFRRFWDHRGNPAAGFADTADVDPLHEWNGNDLGENGPGRRPDDSDAAGERATEKKDDGAAEEMDDSATEQLDNGAAQEIDDGATGETDDGMVVLLIRGEVLRRYPDTTIYAAKAVEDDGDRVPALPNTHVSRTGGSIADDRSEAARPMGHDHPRGPKVPPDRPIEPEPHPPIDPPEPPDRTDPQPPFEPVPPTEPTPPDEPAPRPPEAPIEPPESPSLEADVKFPEFRGTIEPDVTFLGFDLSVEQAVAGPYHDGGPKEDVSHDEAEEGWFFVIEEAPGGTRFGLDEDQGDVGERPYGVTFTSDGRRDTEPLPSDAAQEGAEVGWSALSWGHLVPDDAGGDGGDASDGGSDPVAAISHVSVDGSRPGSEQWAVEAGVEYRESGEDVWTRADAAEWGKNAAHMARITWQQPVRVAVHADDVLPDGDAPTAQAERADTDTERGGDGQ